ncbi:hypothetical protein BS50DRAFT_579946 [Corynespora cassiicola Philippines]|uniref:DNA helicase n=1 Tax=Corynespora cassiicola Philippines TaxID=1448308 RepID=A0A2T2N287_CORCC|nr:hypothetical protein BS50DRAFT_579946 [Corynespora cassiicola Philippines]
MPFRSLLPPAPLLKPASRRPTAFCCGEAPHAFPQASGSMFHRDPITSSSPPPAPDHEPAEAGDAFVTQPTMPLERSPFFALPNTATATQPTQILTPKASRVRDAPSQVQVARSSPAAERYMSPGVASSQSQRPMVNAMAPRGTYSLIPPAVPRPMPVDLTDIASDDASVESDPEEEHGALYQSNIRPSTIETGPSRVEETPQKLSSFGRIMSEFTYVSPRKRAAESFPQANVKRAKPMPRQTAPSRAMPVIDLEDDPFPSALTEIQDIHTRNLVQRLQAIFPMQSVKTLYDALKEKKQNFQDTCDLLAERIDNGTLDADMPAAPSSPFGKEEDIAESKKTAQQALRAPVKSIHQKYALPRQSVTQDAESSPEKPKKKGRLMRGRRNPSPEVDHSSPPRPQIKKPIVISDDDEDEGLPDTESESGAEVEEPLDEDGLLDFFNTCTVEAMVDLSNMKEEDIRSLLDQRPFKSLDAIENIHVDSQAGKKKGRKPKIKFGERLVDSSRSMWNAYAAVDQLVTECEALGKPIVDAMADWGIDIFGAATDGEVAITSLDDSSDASSTRDSGYHTPRSSHGSDTEDVLRKVKGRPPKKTSFLKKPAIMNNDIELKDYQLVGLNWLHLLWKNQVSGILADDMGLGKTCQVIAFLSQLREEKTPGPHLIIVPGSTLENWCREFQHFSDQIRFTAYYGKQPERNQQQLDIEAGIENNDIDVIITTYDMAYKKPDNAFLRRCRPQACIFDEGHMLKNSQAQRYKSLMRLNAEWRLLLTGTPLQNSLQELASILAFLMPDVFQGVEEDLAVVFKHKAKVTESDSHSALLSTQRIQKARSMMTPFVLRRKKAQVLKHMPKKTCRVEYCELTDTQKTLYEEQLEKQRKVLFDRAAGIRTTEHANIMMKLRQAAIHPLLFRHRYTDDKIRKISKACLKEATFRESNPDVIYEELELYQDYQCHQLVTKYPKALGRFKLADQEWMDSGKVAKLVELLKKFRENGDRTLVFSQFTSVMDILQWVLDDLDIGYFRLDGQTPIEQRQQMLDQFYHDESVPVFMLSTKSGGAGINLACANKVIIFDSSFNPQDDIQAENRAHRVGQTREVEVVRLVTRDTVEEQIHALGVSKLELDKMVAGEEGSDQTQAAEAMGIEAVEKMMLAQMQGKSDGSGDKEADVKEQFMEGLKKAGLDLSAA